MGTLQTEIDLFYFLLFLDYFVCAFSVFFSHFLNETLKLYRAKTREEKKINIENRIAQKKRKTDRIESVKKTYK